MPGKQILTWFAEILGSCREIPALRWFHQYTGATILWNWNCLQGKTKRGGGETAHAATHVGLCAIKRFRANNNYYLYTLKPHNLFNVQYSICIFELNTPTLAVLLSTLGRPYLIIYFSWEQWRILGDIELTPTPPPTPWAAKWNRLTMI